MTKDEALNMCFEYIETITKGSNFVRLTKEALAQPEQEPVAWIDKMVIDVPNQLFYTAPHTWVGLTDEERNNIWDTIGNSDAHGDVDGWSGRDVMKAIEAKLKEKNT